MGLESATYVSELNASNPTATDLEAQGDDHLRLLKSVLQSTFPGAAKATYVQQAQADVASATTTDIGAATTDFVRITGTTTITGLGTATAGIRRVCRMEGALILTHNATALIIPGGASITTAAGDRFEAISLGSGNWLVLWFARASGVALAAFASGTIQIFGNSTAPTGWTKGSTHNDKTIRLVTGTPSTGGNTAFSSVFTSRTIAEANLPAVTKSVTGTVTSTLSVGGVTPVKIVHVDSATLVSTTSSNVNVYTTDKFGIAQIASSFSSGVTAALGSGTAMDFAVQYVDMILATKD